MSLELIEAQRDCQVDIRRHTDQQLAADELTRTSNRISTLCSTCAGSQADGSSAVDTTLAGFVFS